MHRECGCAAVAAPIPVYGWVLIKNLKPSNAKELRNKVAAGLNPAAPAALG